MAKTLPQAPDSTDLSSIGPLRESFLRPLSAENKSASTLLTYGKAVEQFAGFVARSAMPADVGSLTREHVEQFLIGLQANGWKPASVANRYRSLQQFFKWLASGARSYRVRWPT
jgi:site-specific recombinase XerC